MGPVYIQGIGIYGRGMVGWDQARAVLAGEAGWCDEDPPKLNPAILPAATRRRTGDYIRLGVEVAREAVERAAVAGSSLASVFATADADGAIAHAICQAVAQPEPMVSPTQFHNSVANAPAGYWSQAVQCFEPSTSIAGWDGAFVTGLLEACIQMATEDRDVLLVSHDVPFPEPLHQVRTIEGNFGVAMVLARQPTANTLAALAFELNTGDTVTTLEDAALERLRLGNPAARVLPLLQAIVRGGEQTVNLEYVGQSPARLTVVAS